ncbi:hypothetical protein Q4I30_001666 [Leishmania utingensis]|uniref:Uncharacterized protein n=1 Tax=Leishmania utingensis TaxID=653362 RepID=A0AAW3AU07_9TRYP
MAAKATATSSTAATASPTAAARKADETRRAAAAVLAHTAKLFSAPNAAGSANAKIPMDGVVGKVAEAAQLEGESLKHPATPTTATTTPSDESRAFPTCWKVAPPPSHASLPAVPSAVQPVPAVKGDLMGARLR